MPLVGGGGVTLSGPNGVLNSLRSSKKMKASPILPIPAFCWRASARDFDLLPQLRFAVNFNDLSFADTEVVDVARNQSGVSKHIGEDLSGSLIYRPLMSQNIVLRASYARLITGHGYKAFVPPAADPNYFSAECGFSPTSSAE